jgi:hypothetical protein
VRVPYREVTNLATVVDWLGELGARTVLLDVEPLVAVWDTGDAELKSGGPALLRQLSRPLRRLLFRPASR